MIALFSVAMIEIALLVVGLTVSAFYGRLSNDRY